jgi:hypothetical protein
VLLFSLMVQMRELASLAPLLIFAQLAIVVALTIIVCNGLVNTIKLYYILYMYNIYIYIYIYIYNIIYIYIYIYI